MVTSRERKALLRYADWRKGRMPWSHEAYVIANEIIHYYQCYYSLHLCDGISSCADIAESLAYDGKVVK